VNPVDTQAQRALDEYLVTGSERREFDDRFPVEVENGEGMVGYQYLHGTNRTSGTSGSRAALRSVPAPTTPMRSRSRGDTPGTTGSIPTRSTRPTSGRGRSARS
jgi:hypothetical protein